jgi:hypothetical protein
MKGSVLFAEVPALDRLLPAGLSGLGLLGAAALLGSATPSQAATCTYAQLATCTLTSGSQTISSFTSNNGTPVIPVTVVTPSAGFQANDTISFTDNGSAWTMVWNFAPGTPIRNRQAINADFLVNITNPLKVFDTVSISRNGTATTGADARFNLNGPSPGPTIATSVLGPFVGPSTASFAAPVSSTTVSLRLFSLTSALTGNLNSVTLTFTQKQVPGPLPLLGASAAFAYSRRIRRRIKTFA